MSTNLKKIVTKEITVNICVSEFWAAKYDIVKVVVKSKLKKIRIGLTFIFVYCIYFPTRTVLYFHYHFVFAIETSRRVLKRQMKFKNTDERIAKGCNPNYRICLVSFRLCNSSGIKGNESGWRQKMKDSPFAYQVIFSH